MADHFKHVPHNPLKEAAEWRRKAAEVYATGALSRWSLLDAAICAVRGYDLAGQAERDLIRTLLVAWDQHSPEDVGK